jgi:farnesyl diphosphate synthase
VLDGGKRLRPLLTLATADLVQGHADAALRAACAVELIHAYSLVHDDMPCMDNDVLRRGKPTVHVQFGQALALLAGDALQAFAFELLTPAVEAMPGVLQAHLCRLLAVAAGNTGMAGGQAIDLAAVGARLTEQELKKMHELKTGALLHASVMMGAACGPCSSAVWEGLSVYGQAIGLAFQVVDDILDVTAQDKPTYVSVLGLPASRQYAEQLHTLALNGLQQTGLPDVRTLTALADWVIRRAY